MGCVQKLFLPALGFLLLFFLPIAPARAGIVIDTTIVTPIEDPHYDVFFDILLQPNTLIKSGDWITVGPISYINPTTGAEIAAVHTPFLGAWSGLWGGGTLGAGQRNILKFTYNGPDFLNNTTSPIDISADLPGYRFGFTTIDLGPFTPEIQSKLTATLATQSSTSDPSGGTQKLLTNGSTSPIIVNTPEPSTLLMLTAAVPALAALCLRQRRGPLMGNQRI